MKNWKRKADLQRWIRDLDPCADFCVLLRGVRLRYSYGLDDFTWQGISDALPSRTGVYAG